jgi:hypothetical protein
VKLTTAGFIALILLAPNGPAAAPTARPAPLAKPAVSTIRYSPSAQAGNLITPAILLGASPIIIIALIIRAMRGD